MRLSDITVEVRNKALERVGLIRPEELVLDLEDVFNNVGTWRLTLASDHPQAAVLRTPGSGLIVTGPEDVLMSGPTTRPEHAATPTDPGGSTTFEGLSDSVALADVLALPEPSNPDLARQSAAHDTRTGPAEALLHAFVNANIGPAAPVVRRKAGLIMGTDEGRGAVVTKSARFPQLGELLAEIAVVAGLGFRIVQRGHQLVFETYAVADRFREIRLDVRNGTLAGHRVAVTPPGVTRVLVAGQGELTARRFLQVTTTESLAAEAEWGRRIERFLDQRQTSDLAELQQAGDELLAEEGRTAVVVQAVPPDDSSMEFGRAWGLGDRVGVVVEDQELTSTVTGMVLKASSAGFRVGALLGDPTGFDRQAAIAKRMTATEQRVSQLERNGSGDNDQQIMSIMGAW
jgi:hypothetical protein